MTTAAFTDLGLLALALAGWAGREGLARRGWRWGRRSGWRGPHPTPARPALVDSVGPKEVR